MVLNFTINKIKNFEVSNTVAYRNELIYYYFYTFVIEFVHYRNIHTCMYIVHRNIHICIYILHMKYVINICTNICN